MKMPEHEVPNTPASVGSKHNNHKYREWENKRFRFLDGTFYHDRFKDAASTVVKIGPILAHYQVDGMPSVYTMPLQNLDQAMNVVTPVED